MTAAEYDRAPRVLTADYDSPAAASLEAIWATEARSLWMDLHRRPQGDRHPLHRHRLRLPDPRRPRGAGDAPAARPSQTSRCSRPEQYDQLFSDARHDDDLPLCAAGAVGLQQLPLAAAAGRARHGVPAAERLLLLDLSGGRALPLRRLRCRRRAERRLVQLRPLCAQGSSTPASTSTSMRSA